MRHKLHPVPLEVLRRCRGWRYRETCCLSLLRQVLFFAVLSSGFSCAKKWKTLTPNDKGPFKSYEEVSVPGKNGSKPVDPQKLMDICKKMDGHSIMLSFEKASGVKCP